MSQNETVAVKITDLNKYYGSFHALCDINLSVKKGEKIVNLVTKPFYKSKE